MKWLTFLCALLFSVTVISTNYSQVMAQDKAQNTDNKPYKMPEFTHHMTKEWINSEPLSREDLKGKVILIDMWTFDCWNCYRSFPWLNALEEKYQKSGLQIIGVHTPEFDHEKIRANIEAKVKNLNYIIPL